MWDHRRVSELMTDVLSRGSASLIGLFLLFATTASLMRTVVIPRSLRSVISDTVARIVTSTATALSRLRKGYIRRDAVLAWAGPSTILLQLITWLLLYLLAYGLLLYGIGGQDLGDSLRQAGSSLFTLGFASVNTQDQTVIDFFAAATGPIVIALMIGFLPTIYSAYLEREVDVTTLSTAAGEPAWGPELLSRFALTDNLPGLTHEFGHWGEAAARLRMTHVTYPVLVWVRSARAMRHYAIALLAVMDAAALQVALNRSLERTGAHRLLVQGGQAFEVLYVIVSQRRRWRPRRPLIGRVATPVPGATSSREPAPGWSHRMNAVEQAAEMDALMGMDSDAVAALGRGEQRPLRLTRADFDRAVVVLQQSGFPIDEDLDEAWERFRKARQRYEYAAYSLCEALDVTPAPWSGERRPPTPVVWPSLAVDLLDSETPEDPDAPGHRPGSPDSQ